MTLDEADVEPVLEADDVADVVKLVEAVLEADMVSVLLLDEVILLDAVELAVELGEVLVVIVDDTEVDTVVVAVPLAVVEYDVDIVVVPVEYAVVDAELVFVAVSELEAELVAVVDGVLLNVVDGVVVCVDRSHPSKRPEVNAPTTSLMDLAWRMQLVLSTLIYPPETQVNFGLL